MASRYRRRSTAHENPAWLLPLLLVGGAAAAAGGAAYYIGKKKTAATNAANNAATAASQALPSGSYQQTCQNCTFDGTTLSCQCRDDGGALQATSLSVPANGTTQGTITDIANLNGTLALQGGTISAQALPGGSYSETCVNCSFDGTTLTCQCKNKAGTYEATSLKTGGSNNISNVNGVLTA